MMIESSAFQVIEDLANERLLRGILRKQGTRKFGAPTDEQATTLAGIENLGRLRQLAARLIKVDSWDALLRGRDEPFVGGILRGQAMTEAEWLASGYPYEVLRHAIQDDDSAEFKNRKAILFVAACCSHIQMSCRSRVEKEAIEWLLAKADGVPEDREKPAILWSLERASRRRTNERDVLMAIRTSVSETRISNFYDAVFLVAKRISRAVAQGDKVLEEEEDRIHCGFIRDIFGNPFHPITLDASWLTSTVSTIARQMYDTRDFSATPILADALQDAGCDNDDILDHCRGPGPHVRGCWVVDLLAGRK